MRYADKNIGLQTGQAKALLAYLKTEPVCQAMAAHGFRFRDDFESNLHTSRSNTMIKNTRTLAATLLLMLTAPWQAMADEVQVAVASNFLAPLTEIATAFKQETRNNFV